MATKEMRPESDLVLLVQACSAAFGDRILMRARAAAGDAVRFNDGYVFQHLVSGPISITELAARLGVTQQAASKQVSDLESRRLVRRRADPADGRSKLVELSDLGWQAIEASRAGRKELLDEIAELIGPRRTATILTVMREISDHLGALDAMAGRRLRPEADR